MTTEVNIALIALAMVLVICVNCLFEKILTLDDLKEDLTQKLFNLEQKVVRLGDLSAKSWTQLTEAIVTIEKKIGIEDKVEDKK